MLQHLKIKNLALVKEVQLEFKPGFTVLTGETGAGKSVLLGALGLLAGARADKNIVGKYGATCEVEGLFFFQNASRIDAFLTEKGLPACEDGNLILKRSISVDKAMRVYINGSATTVLNLLQLGSLWVDFHGPGEHQKLLQEEYQLEMLDAFNPEASIKKNYQEIYHSWQKAKKIKKDLEQTEILGEDERQFLQMQLEKMQSLEISPESIEDLEKKFNKYTKAQDIQVLCSQIMENWMENTGIFHLLRDILKKNIELSKYNLSEAIDLGHRLESVLIECEDIAKEYHSINSSLDIDEETISFLQQKMQLWLEIKRKYGPTVEKVALKIKEIQEKIENQENIEVKIYELEEKLKKIEAELQFAARALQKARSEIAKQLSQEAALLLKKLGFQNPRLSVEIVPEKEFLPYGDCSVNMLFSANIGQALLPLNKIASSGEMARVMLAIKTLLAKVDATPLLVFDEVDANVGGEVGQEVAKELAKLAKNHQVFCVTHLPQVAALGQNHWVVKKYQTQEDTHVSIETIDHDKRLRLEELARMLGDRTSQTALEHAKMLLRV